MIPQVDRKRRSFGVDCVFLGIACVGGKVYDYYIN
ncbi:hypothetical protein QF041_002193 [Paenibacillus sp. W2I17]|nr:hypothetical protein [Paenibacillus sp. W2I17]